MKSKYILIFFLVIGLLMAACGKKEAASPQDTSSEREAPPSQYADMENPFTGDGAAIAKGQDLFFRYCKTCHGDEGLGDGPAAASLDPRPAPLATNQNGLSDAYLFWRISEGGAGAPFNSGMPPWKSALSEDEIWMLISFIRTLK
jgi:mono/diheme cytochrome c family protein